MTRRAAIEEILARAREKGRKVLLEPEGYALLQELALSTPPHLVVRDAFEAEAADLSVLHGDKVVVKVLSADILHKSDQGGVVVVSRDTEAVVAAVTEMESRLGSFHLEGFLVSEHVAYDPSLGGELLLGMRWTEDFGPTVTLAVGGIYTEFLSESFRAGQEAAVVSPVTATPVVIRSALEETAVACLVTGGLRAQKARVETEALVDLISAFTGLAQEVMPEDVSELEINPLVLTPEGPVALDVLVRLGPGARVSQPPRPLHRLGSLLNPESIAIMGVSQRMNPGRIILQNTLSQGFDPEKIHIIKPGAKVKDIDGCRCYPDLASVPGQIDLLILAVAAPQVPAIVDEVVGTRKAESLIVIPGGLGERKGTEALAEQVRLSLDRSRATEWKGPIFNGANCLGVRSRPGRYDTLFIPDYKLPDTSGPESPLALISQSGAFAVARASKLAEINPRYIVTVGNQTDLTVADYLEYLKSDKETRVFACYVEGFKSLDGQRWLAAAKKITRSGRTVILYRAGRTAAGAAATVSHTASVAGDYAVTRELAKGAGVVVADSLADFDDLIRLFCQLGDKSVDGYRLGALSNAGFESVAIADSLGPFQLADLSERTSRQLDDLLGYHSLSGIVGVQNPLDVTPILGDEPFVEASRLILEDDSVDVGLIGCVPLTGALSSLAPGSGHGEDVFAQGSVARRLGELKKSLSRAWVAVVDGGVAFDAMVSVLVESGVPTFRTADRALRLFALYCQERIRTEKS